MQRLGTLTAALCRFAPQDMFKLRDVTEDAKEVVKCVRQLTSSPRSNYTLLHFVELFKGEQSGGLTCLMHVLFVVLQDSKTCASLVSSLLSCRFSKCLLHGCPFFFSCLFFLFFFRFSKALTSWVSHLCLADSQTVHIAVGMLQDPQTHTSFVLLGYLAGSHNSRHGCPNCCFAGFQNMHIIYVLHRYLAGFQNSCIMDVPIFLFFVLQGPKTPTWLTRLLFCRIPKLLHHGCPNCCFAGSQNSRITDVPIVVLQGPKTPASRMSQLLFCRVPKLPHHGCPNCCFAGSPNSRITDIPIIVL